MKIETMRKNAIPFFLRPALIDGKPVTAVSRDGRPVMVMEPYPFSLKMAADWWEPCSRREDWQTAPGGSATVPPCLAWHADNSLQNCKKQVIVDCTNAVARRFHVEPMKLQAAAKLATTLNLARQAMQDDDAEYGPLHREEAP